MRAKIKVTDLNLRQWDYITTKVPVDGRDFVEPIPRACVVFELTPDMSEIHVEMDVVELAALMVTLESIKNEPAVAELAEGLLSETPGSGSDGDYPAGTKHVGPFELG